MTTVATVPFVMSDRERFARSVLETGLDGAGAFADWLEENGDEYAGRLLRRRWLRWKTERSRNAWQVRAWVHNNDPTQYPVYDPPTPAYERLAKRLARMADESFDRYIRKRFVVPFKVPR